MNPQILIFIDWCIKVDSETNHHYAKKLPYEFHLQLVHNSAIQFKHIWEKIGKFPFEFIECGCYGHDLITDSRQTYNDIVKAFGEPNAGKIIAEMIRAVSEDVRGRNREERMPSKIYKEIRETPGALFLKLSDRIGNVKFGKLMNSNMRKLYEKEHAHFKEELYHEDYKEMWDYLETLFND